MCSDSGYDGGRLGFLILMAFPYVIGKSFVKTEFRMISLMLKSCGSIMEKEPSVNVYDEPLLVCSESPMTGFFRDGCCNTSEDDFGSHTVCIEVSQAFLEYSRFKGNDLSTPKPEFGFPGLKEGDRWCLCASRWLEAFEQNMAPRVFMRRTHKKALDIIPIEVLRDYALDLS